MHNFMLPSSRPQMREALYSLKIHKSGSDAEIWHGDLRGACPLLYFTIRVAIYSKEEFFFWGFRVAAAAELQR